MTRFLALAAALALAAGTAQAESHEGGEAMMDEGMMGEATMQEAPAYQLDVEFVCGAALESQGHYADNLISWIQARCQDGFIGADVCKEVNHYVAAYSAQVKEQVAACSEKIQSED